jgi:hypothetical protein
MTERKNVVRVDALEKTIEALTHDLRVPKRLRVALAVFQKERTVPKDRGLSLLPVRSIGLSRGLGAIADVCQCNDAQSSSDEERTILSRVQTTVEQGLEIQMWLNDESLDWSVEINGQCHEHVSSDVMEALVECALIMAEASLMKASVSRPQ